MKGVICVARRNALNHMPPPWKGAPDIPDLPRCPVCMEEAKTYYIGYWGGIVGCDRCIKEVDSVEYEAEKRLNP